MRTQHVILVILVGSLVMPFVALESFDDARLKRPLDLPSGGVGTDDEEEDAAEVIHFYGSEYEGNAFFWCLDFSGSMEWDGRADVLKHEMTQSLNSLSRETEFNVCAFGSHFVMWAGNPKVAVLGAKASAIAWVNSRPYMGGTELANAMIALIENSHFSRKSDKTFIVVSDGDPNNPGPEQTLTMITGANTERRPINTIKIGFGGGSFMQDLASENGGSYQHVH